MQIILKKHITPIEKKIYKKKSKSQKLKSNVYIKKSRLVLTPEEFQIKLKLRRLRNIKTQKRYAEKHREEIRAYQKKYSDEHREKNKISSRKYYLMKGKKKQQEKTRKYKKLKDDKITNDKFTIIADVIPTDWSIRAGLLHSIPVDSSTKRELLNCPFCTSFWLGLIVALQYLPIGTAVFIAPLAMVFVELYRKITL